MPVIGALFVCSGPGLADNFTPPAASTAPFNIGVSTDTEPFIWPVAKLIAGKKVQVVSKYGTRKAFAAAIVGRTPPGATPIVALSSSTVDEMHEGIDFAVPPGSSVRAARSGKVLFAGFSGAYVSRADKKDKNRLVIVMHADGRSSRYVHLARLLVGPRQTVKAGDPVGTSAPSDEWVQPVLHFEIREANGKALDPLPLINATTTQVTLAVPAPPVR